MSNARALEYYYHLRAQDVTPDDARAHVRQRFGLEITVDLPAPDEAVAPVTPEPSESEVDRLRSERDYWATVATEWAEAYVRLHGELHKARAENERLQREPSEFTKTTWGTSTGPVDGIRRVYET